MLNILTKNICSLLLYDVHTIKSEWTFPAVLPLCTYFSIHMHDTLKPTKMKRGFWSIRSHLHRLHTPQIRKAVGYWDNPLVVTLHTSNASNDWKYTEISGKSQHVRWLRTTPLVKPCTIPSRLQHCMEIISQMFDIMNIYICRKENIKTH